MLKTLDQRALNLAQLVHRVGPKSPSDWGIAGKMEPKGHRNSSRHLPSGAYVYYYIYILYIMKLLNNMFYISKSPKPEGQSMLLISQGTCPRKASSMVRDR